MAATLVAIVMVLLLGHFMPSLAVLRRREPFLGWMRWWSGRRTLPVSSTRVLALLLPLVVVGLLQWLLHGWGWQVPATVFGILALFHAWGPRDLDRDVEAVVAGVDAEERRSRAVPLFACGTPVSIDGPALVGAVFRSALWRWFGPLLWFILLGPVGALGYCWVALAAQEEAASPDTSAQVGWVLRLHALLDWPVAQLMTLTLALAADFDAVIGAWREWHEPGIRLGLGYLDAAARASVASELADEEAMPIDGPPQAPALLELRDAMSLVWRLLILWLAALALFVLAGFVG